MSRDRQSQRGSACRSTASNDMRCSECQVENELGANFCSHCGRQILLTCPKCGAGNPSGSRFCAQCGADLIPARAPPATNGFGPGGTALAVESIAAASPERRQVTMMFCDLVGSTALSERLDPEEYREVILEYQRICRST